MTDDFRAIVDPAVAERFPEYRGAVLVASGLVNGPTDAASDALLGRAEESLRARGLDRAADDAHIAAWRATFSAFGAKPSKYPSSAEALASRVLKGGELPRINALVDVYNAVSVRHLAPLGGEDAARVRGVLRLVIADGSEPFDPRDDGAEIEHPSAGEIVWRDDAGVTCRRWNWRQGRRTQITESTTSAFFVIDTLALEGGQPRTEGGQPRPDAVARDLAAELQTRCPAATVTIHEL